MRIVDIHGAKFLAEEEPSDYWQWIEEGRYHADIHSIKRFASPEKTCIDVGAWIGAYTLFASQIYKQVYAIEPDPVAIEILRRNIEANGVSNVIVANIALSDHLGTVTLGGSALGCSCTRRSCDLNAVTVPCTTLREFAKDIPDPLFIKIDVEGSEAEILRDWEFFAERKPDVMLSAHPAWWEEGGSDGTKEYATITKVGKLYKKAFANGTSVRVNFDSCYGDIVLTDD